MGEKHYVVLEVMCEMEEMDGSPSESAEIAMTLVEEMCYKNFAFGEVSVKEYGTWDEYIRSQQWAE